MGKAGVSPPTYITNDKIMARTKLFKTAEELMVGYGLKKAANDLHEARGRKAGSEKRKVYLRGRLLKDGKVGLYVMAFQQGKKVRKSIGILNVETDGNVKSQNEEVLRMAKANADMLNSDAERLRADFAPIGKSAMLLSKYVEKVGKECLEKSGGNKHGYYYQLMGLNEHLELFRGPSIKLKDVNEDFLKDFIQYLRTAKNQVYHRFEDKSQWKDVTVSAYTKHRLYENLHYVIRKAKKEKLIINDPFENIERNERPKMPESAREYLTAEEVKKLMDTDCESEELKRAFLFCCFVGLRYSDACRLTWGNINKDDAGECVSMTMKKTKHPVKAYISDVAKTFLPARGEAKDDDSIFTLPRNDRTNKLISAWAKAAGITKHVTFHVSRHTSATMLLNLDVPLEVVSKQLGHTHISTTEIYAKVMAKTQASAINKQDDLFK